MTGLQEGGHSVSGVACDGIVNGERLSWQRLAVTHGGGGRSGSNRSFLCDKGEVAWSSQKALAEVGGTILVVADHDRSDER
ncbi:putative keratin, type II cuticular Hb1 [Sesbania bispinosa]|nr:putative keratin, type II cuticular Hb1 [Sesbania bispinosa]